MAVSGIAFVMYPVTDMARSQKFYEEVLGLKPSGLSSPAWVEFDIAGGTFGIGNFEQVGKPGTAQSLALEVEDMDAFRARLAEKGYDVPAPFETPVCFISGISDPDGNQVVLHQLKGH